MLTLWSRTHLSFGCELIVHVWALRLKQIERLFVSRLRWRVVWISPSIGSLLLGSFQKKNLPAVEELNLVAPWNAIPYYAMRVPSTCVVPENCLMRPTTMQTKSNSQMASKQSHDKRIWKIFILCIFFEIIEKSSLPYTLVFSWLTKVSWKTTSRLWNYPRAPFEQKKTC